MNISQLHLEIDISSFREDFLFFALSSGIFIIKTRYISIRGYIMENYLKSIDPNLPRDNLIVISSISGFESRFLYLIYIKYRRRKGFAIENLSTYVRRLFENNEATDGDRVYSLSLVISIKKETSSKIHIQVLRWLRKFRKYRYDINAR